jgi:predicted dehydrogenase
MKKYKLAVVGPGLIGKKHIELIRASDQATLSAIVAPEQNAHMNLACALGVPLFSRIEDCLSQCELDGVIISSPNRFHFAQASACIKAGISVLVEKPVTIDLLEAKELVLLANSHDCQVLVGHHRVYSPLLASAKKAIAEGRLGRLVSVMGSAQFYKPTQYFKDGPWRAELGGGPILINMIHEVGNLRALIGEIIAVQAIASSKVRNFAVEDTVAINFVFANGVLGTFLLSDTAATAKSWELTSGENPSYPSYSDEDCYAITGTRGSLAFPSMRLKSYPSGVIPSWWNPFAEEVLPSNRDDPLRLQLEHFIRVIGENESPMVSVVEGFRNLLITESIKKSILTQSLVEIKE